MPNSCSRAGDEKGEEAARGFRGGTQGICVPIDGRTPTGPAAQVTNLGRRDADSTARRGKAGAYAVRRVGKTDRGSHANVFHALAEPVSLS